MNPLRFAFKVMALVIFTLATSSLVQAQAFRTWVSGVGDDANPCSRTAPCKTFAGAISKTATNGEIDVMDPGAFGALTITKSITIDGGTGAGWASISNNISSGIVVNAANATVNIRHIGIIGLGAGIKGINVVAVKSLNIESVQIHGFTQEGISVSLGTGANINIRNSIITGCGLNGGVTGAGIRANTTATGLAGAVYLTVFNTNSDNNNEGYRIENNVRATITNSTASNNTLNGFDSFGGGADATETNLEGCTAAGNKQWGVYAFTNGTVRMSNTIVTNNAVQGLMTQGTGQILSFSNNKVQGNGSNGQQNGAPTGTGLSPL